MSSKEINQLLKKCQQQIQLKIDEEITFFGSTDEANPVSLYGGVQIEHSLLKDIIGKNLLIRVNGFAKVFWDEECSYFAIMASRKRLLWQEQTLSLHPDLILDNSNYSHCFPFHFTLEGNLPPSFDLYNDGIFYLVELVMLYDSYDSRNGYESKEEVLCSKPFDVKRCILPTMIPYLLSSTYPSHIAMSLSATPEYSNISSTSSDEGSESSIPLNILSSPHIQPLNGDPFSSEKWVGVYEGLSYCLVTPKCMVIGDKEFQFKLLLSNQNNTSLSNCYLTASLKQVMDCHVDEAENDLMVGRLFQKSLPTAVSRTSNNQKVPLDPKKETALLVRLPLHNDLIEDLDCELIRVTHHIKLKLKFSRFSKKKLILTFPVYVTCLQDLPPPYEV